MEQLEQTLTSMEVAEMVEKDHSKLLKDIRRYSEQLNEANIGLVEFFTDSTYLDAKGEKRPCYKVTKKGCEFIAHKLTGIKGTEFTAKYINRFHAMEQAIQNRPLSEKEMMRIQLGMIDDVDSRVTKLENTMNIDYGQQKVLKEKVSSHIIQLVGGKKSNAYRELSKKVFKEFGHDYNDYFNVNSRANTPRIRFNEAVGYVEAWQPSTNTTMMIRNSNAQLSIG